MQWPVLSELEDLSASRGWLHLGDSAMGMYYDMDAAIIKTFRIGDSQFRISFAEDGGLVADVELPPQVRTLRAADVLFYRFWSKVSFPLSLIKREVAAGRIAYSFTTGDQRLGYRGVVNFVGDGVARIVRRAEGQVPQ